MEGKNLNKGYQAKEVENRWYSYWEEQGLFTASEESDGKPFSIVIPPPNVTGVLHMGHALNITLQDILCRYRRLCGDNVLWLPGTDHAGIATQNVVERQLAADGNDRHEMGRKRFIEAVWEWRRKYGSAIIRQLKSLGASCDWTRERFTMDQGLSRAVRKVFVDLYEQGLIYRGNYIINWCPRCSTALAEIEVEHEEHGGYLYYIRYPYVKGEGGPVVATTRPETMLGDTALAVHPEDNRYSDISADRVILPLIGREIPVIRDEYVDMEFGTGALKITPAHDPNDFIVGERHGLDRIKVIGDDGKMTAEAGEFVGMDRFECREAVVEALKEQELLIKIEDYTHSVGHCYRCSTIVEPNLSRQWFVKTEPLAEKAIDAVRQSQTRIIPEKWENDYYNWMENIRDWCISRQIWWGHQIPAWTCEDCGELIVSMNDPATCPACGSANLARDPDVLDTWFSSALWPFSTMGWPEKTKLLEIFYPTSVLVTGFDILFFWVARMMMMGLHFMGEVPFKDVYVHALVRDEDGRKMSKSSGNVIDPMDMIENYGTDSLRFTLAAFAAQGRDIKLSEKRIEGYRHFINKLWNAARFAFMHITEPHPKFEENSLGLADRWILSRLRRTADGARDALDNYHFNDGANILYRFVWHEFCDWYLEISKPALYGKVDDTAAKGARAALWRVLHDTLIFLHPFIPFVTEEIWHKLPGTKGSIMTAHIPGTDIAYQEIHIDPGAEAQMDLIMGVVTAVRNIRGEMNIPPSALLSVLVQSDSQDVRNTVDRHGDVIAALARLEELKTEKAGEKPGGTATAIVGDATVSVYLEGVIDFSKEIERLEKEIAKMDKELAGLSKKLGNPGFLAKAPRSVVEKVRSQYNEGAEKIEKLKTNRDRIKSLESVQS
ncbi:MAG: valine--tRNA ligase [Desulfobacteraceae bacterium]|nr:valine--tRNA ligase [Desulfobacteraceae bacterium]